jgi:hypothetical protein
MSTCRDSQYIIVNYLDLQSIRDIRNRAQQKIILIFVKSYYQLIKQSKH